MRFFILLFIITISSSEVFSQRNGRGSSTRGARNSYQSLLAQNRVQGGFFDVNQFPKGDSTEVIVSFRLSYQALAFMKVNPNSEVENLPENAQYFVSIEMGLEIAPRDSSDLPKPPVEEMDREGIKLFDRARRKAKDDEPESFNGKYRSFWRDVAIAETFEQTKSANDYVEGYFRITLAPGFYAYTIQVKESGRARERSVPPRPLRVTDFNKPDALGVLFTSVRSDSSLPNLLNFGTNTFYGKDFGLLVFTKDREDLNLTITEEKSKKKVFEISMTDDNVFTKDGIPALNDSTSTKLISSENEGWKILHINIPGSEFTNGRFQLALNDSSPKPLASRRFMTLWQDMPISLLNVDAALDMLVFILPESKVESMKEGSQEEKAEAFTNFWKKQDPTPKTEFNELMTEYYRRIDYSYQKFTTPSMIGFESDQGLTYIRRGPPSSVKREFPVGQQPIEIWVYSDTEIKFQATSGFGDFRRIK